MRLLVMIVGVEWNYQSAF